MSITCTQLLLTGYLKENSVLSFKNFVSRVHDALNAPKHCTSRQSSNVPALTRSTDVCVSIAFAEAVSATLNALMVSIAIATEGRCQSSVRQESTESGLTVDATKYHNLSTDFSF